MLNSSRSSATATGRNWTASGMRRLAAGWARWIKIKRWVDRQMFVWFALIWWAIAAWMTWQALDGRPQDVMAALIAGGVALVFTWVAVRIRRWLRED